jgi:hypothetical protein
MLKEHLKKIKGELVEFYAESCHDMSLDKEGEVDYELFYEDFEIYVADIFRIKTLDDLDRFLQETDLWGRGMGLDYFVGKYCEKSVTLGGIEI